MALTTVCVRNVYLHIAIISLFCSFLRLRVLNYSLHCWESYTQSHSSRIVWRLSMKFTNTEHQDKEVATIGVDEPEKCEGKSKSFDSAGNIN